MKEFCFLILISLFSQNSFGQILIFKDVTQLPASINSDAEESLPIISEDGKKIYFVRSFYSKNKGGAFAGHDIWLSEYKDSTWQEAINQLGVFNNKKNNAVIGLRENGQTVYLLDSYNSPVGGIAFSKFINNKWTKPEKIPIKGLSKEGNIGYFMNPTYDVLLISMKGHDTYGEEDLYVSVKEANNKWSDPKNLGATINSKGFEISPFLTKDKKYLFFASNGHPGFGDADIFYSERLYDSWDVWSAPKNLGPVINSKSFDAFFTITSDSIVYFSSNRNSINSDILRSVIKANQRDVSQAKIDSLIKEANSMLLELQKIRGRNSEEILILFEYNKFILDQEYVLKLDEILQSIKNKDEIMIQLTSFSFEDYAINSKKLIINKREQSIRDFFISKNISTLNIIIENSSEKIFNKFSNDRLGGVKVQISY